MLLTSITGVKKVSTLTSLSGIRSSDSLSGNDLLLMSISGPNAGDSNTNLFSNGYASVKVSFSRLLTSIANNLFSTNVTTAGTFTSDGYLQIKVNGANKYIRLYDRQL